MSLGSHRMRVAVVLPMVAFAAACARGAGTAGAPASADRPEPAVPAASAPAAGQMYPIAPDSPAPHAAPSSATGGTVTGLVPPARRWWDDRTFYEIFVRSFQDSDGDGIGDLQGVIDRLDYLNDGDPDTDQDLGVTGVWLMPIFASPSSHGYDTTDFRSVNPDYGTLEDLHELLAAAHRRGIAVILDLTLNHTSSRHSWFQASSTGMGDKADWYEWIDGTSDATGPWGQQLWYGLGGRSYLALFDRSMPDLNLANAAVTAELEDTARYWLMQGVDGFRLDAAQHLVEQDERYANTPATMGWLAGFNTFVKSVRSDALLVGEVWSDSATSSSYVPTQVDLAFDFPSAHAAAMLAIIGQADPLLASTQKLAGYPQHGAAVFTDNHDLSRLASLAFDDPARLRLLATWLLTQPGVPFIFYGQEIGMPGQKPDERIRSPLPWTAADPSAGFSTGTPWEPLQGGWHDLNVVGQQNDPASLLSLYRRLIRLRTELPALRSGSVRTLEVDDPAGFAALRRLDGQQVIVLGNASAKPLHDLTMDVPGGSAGTWTSLLGQRIDQPVGRRFTPIHSLRPWETAILLKRS